MNHLGMKIVSHPLAEKVERVAVISRTPIKKRRRGWQLRYDQRRTPCTIVIDGTVYAHPDIYAQLSAITKERA